MVVRFQASRTCDELGLGKNDLVGGAGLSLVQLLSNAGDDTKTTLQSVGCFLTNELTHTQTANHKVCTERMMFVFLLL